MSALILDAGALLAVDRGDRAMIARLQVALGLNCVATPWSWPGFGAIGEAAR